MTKTELIEYAVKFTIYQYNSGAGDNGIYNFEKRFLYYSDAVEFRDHLLEYYSKKEFAEEYQTRYIEFIETYLSDGFLKKVDGNIYIRVTLEERI